jgi:hypothetical protein
MSKKRIDETMTKARQAREKKAREQAETEATVELLVTKDGIEKIEPETPDARPTVAEFLENEGHPEAAAVAAQHAHDADGPEVTGKKTRGLAVVPDAPTEPTEDLVVFAMRLTTAERDAIHSAAGPGKASKFVRQVAIAAARGDVDAVTRLIDARVK